MDVDHYIAEVKGAIREALDQTPLHPLLDQLSGSLYGGKMLRSRMAFRMGVPSGVPVPILVRGAAAIEMLHAASLLHDDVIDGASLRRNAPAFWVSRGTSGSILVGDMMVCTSFSMIMQAQSNELIPEFVSRAREMCEAEVEQELLRREDPDWETSVKFARNKTGSLFAFIGFLSGVSSPELAVITREIGHIAGTAYQLADDIFDSYGDKTKADKSLGLDARKPKTTAVSGWKHDQRGAPGDPVAFIRELCAKPDVLLAGHPAALAGWHDYLEQDLEPAIGKFVKGFTPAAARR